MGYRDIVYLPEKSLLVTVTSDMSAISRIDSYVTNMNLPWEKNKGQVLLSVGVLEVWVQSKKQDGFSFDRLWAKSFKSQAICIGWNEALSCISAGCDDGTVQILRIDTEQPMKYKELYSGKVHNGRVMGMYIDGIRNLLFTISEDKTLKSLDLKGKAVNSEAKVSSAKLCCLEVDPRTKVAYITDRAGAIHVYDLTSNPPCSTQMLQTNSKGALRGLQVDTDRGFLFTSCFDDGQIYVYRMI